MTDTVSIHDTDEAWESGALGLDEEHAEVVSTKRGAEIDELLGLRAISIRLPISLIEDYKLIAKLHGMGYQPLMREALIRFADHEKKRALIEYANQMEQKKEQILREQDLLKNTVVEKKDCSDDEPAEKQAA